MSLVVAPTTKLTSIQGVTKLPDGRELKLEPHHVVQQPMLNSAVINDIQIVQAAFPLAVVVANILGAVNQALLTLAYAKSRGLSVRDLIFSDIAPVDITVFHEHLRMLQSVAPKILNEPLPRILHLQHCATDFT